MMSYSWLDYRSVLGLAGILVFIIQIVLCLKLPKSRIRFIPVFLLTVCQIFIILLYLGVFWNDDGAYFSGNQLLALLLGIAWAVPAFADLLAWICIWLRRLYLWFRRRQSEGDICNGKGNK